MSNTAPAKVTDVSLKAASVTNTLSDGRTSIRVSPNGYFTALFLLTFFSGFLIYLEIDWALLLFGAAWLVLPMLLWRDRIVFDGKRLTRTGLLPNLWALLNNSRNRLKLTDIEQIETQSLRALKRGGKVFYRYRTSIRGRDLQFAFASGGEDYRQMIRQIFPRLPENVLDNRSIELRDYLREPEELLMKTEFEKIPSAEVLENSSGDFCGSDKRSKIERKSQTASEEEIEKSDDLRRLGNELRLSGFLLQALEAFRRALILNPQDDQLLFEFARCLHSFAGSEKDQKLERRALAVLRLAEKRAAGNGPLLSRLAESYFQFGKWRRAKNVFQKAIAVAETNFRSARGLAEIALREGKIAHVIHHFANANRLAETAALRRWTQGETDYFSRLHDDEDYMELEISRVNLLEKLESAKKTSLRVALFGFPAILLGLISDDNLIANIGWAVSSLGLLIWIGLLLSQRVLSERIPFELLEEEPE